jgi:hypothetical protein
VRALDEELGKKAGVLLGRSGAEDAVGAALICLAADGDDTLTSDPGDLRALAGAAGVHVDLVPVRRAVDAWAGINNMCGDPRSAPVATSRWAENVRAVMVVRCIDTDEVLVWLLGGSLPVPFETGSPF